MRSRTPAVVVVPALALEARPEEPRHRDDSMRPSSYEKLGVRIACHRPPIARASPQKFRVTPSCSWTRTVAQSAPTEHLDDGVKWSGTPEGCQGTHRERSSPTTKAVKRHCPESTPYCLLRRNDSPLYGLRPPLFLVGRSTSAPRRMRDNHNGKPTSTSVQSKLGAMLGQIVLCIRGSRCPRPTWTDSLRQQQKADRPAREPGTAFPALH